MMEEPQSTSQVTFFIKTVSRNFEQGPALAHRELFEVRRHLLYHIPQTPQNQQIKFLFKCLAFRTEFIMHNATMIKKTSSTAFTHEHTCHTFLGERKSRHG
jgi:hypothetical protein